MKKLLTFFCVLLINAFFFTVSNAQVNWTKDSGNPIIPGGDPGTWNKHVSAPNVLYNPDSVRYEMWFDASMGEPNWRPYRIGFATSPDGLTWTKVDTAVLKPTTGTWDAYTVECPMVLRENGQYKMWYGSWSPTTPDGIGYATSPNGTDWTKQTSNPVMGPGTATWEIGGADYCCVLSDTGGGYKMWYTGYNVSYTIAQIGYATSPDGITWIKADSVNPVLTTGISGEWDDVAARSPKVIFKNGIYYMWYVGAQGGTYRSIGLATSLDGINWIKYDDPNTTSTLYASSDPVLNPGPGTWDDRAVESGTVMSEGDSLRMWYGGSGDPVSSLPWKIGHATALLEPNSINNNDFKNIPKGFVISQNYPNPFNPTTTIEFSIPKAEFVILKIYNLLGQEVETLESDKLNAGIYNYSWDASGFASGIYFYNIQAGDFVQTRKLVLMK